MPRIWEKLKAGLEAMQAAQPEEQRAPVQAAIEASIERVRLRQQGEPVPRSSRPRWPRPTRTCSRGSGRCSGLDQALAVNVGAAPTPVAVLEFFHALGIELAELWGMSETCGTGAVNRPGAVRIGTVGPASPGVEIRLADDGEVLCRGEFIMTGYRNQPERTAEAIDADGWLHTGDIGTLDEDGYLKIVDRKKELIINAAGKNMSPANIEAAIKSGSPLIGQACCIGDGRSYNTALIVLDADFAPQWAAQHGLQDRSFEELAAEPAVIATQFRRGSTGPTKLARVEQIKKFTIIPGDWVPGGDELTPTIKLKRKPIAEKYERRDRGDVRLGTPGAGAIRPPLGGLERAPEQLHRMVDGQRRVEFAQVQVELGGAAGVAGGDGLGAGRAAGARPCGARAAAAASGWTRL